MLSPWNFSGIKLRIEPNLLAINNDSMFISLDVEGESTMSRVIGKKILEVFGVHHGVIDGSHVKSSRVLES